MTRQGWLAARKRRRALRDAQKVIAALVQYLPGEATRTRGRVNLSTEDVNWLRKRVPPLFTSDDWRALDERCTGLPRGAVFYLMSAGRAHADTTKIPFAELVRSPQATQVFDYLRVTRTKPHDPWHVLVTTAARWHHRAELIKLRRTAREILKTTPLVRHRVMAGLPEGYKLYQLIAADLDLEGLAMGHCLRKVATGSKAIGRFDFSVRGTQGLPVLTMTVQIKRQNTLEQIKGEWNRLDPHLAPVAVAAITRVVKRLGVFEASVDIDSVLSTVFPQPLDAQVDHHLSMWPTWRGLAAPGVIASGLAHLRRWFTPLGLGEALGTVSTELLRTLEKTPAQAAVVLANMEILLGLMTPVEELHWRYHLPLWIRTRLKTTQIGGLVDACIQHGEASPTTADFTKKVGLITRKGHFGLPEVLQMVLAGQQVPHMLFVVAVLTIPRSELPQMLARLGTRWGSLTFLAQAAILRGLKRCAKPTPDIIKNWPVVARVAAVEANPALGRPATVQDVLVGRGSEDANMAWCQRASPGLIRAVFKKGLDQLFDLRMEGVDESDDDYEEDAQRPQNEARDRFYLLLRTLDGIAEERYEELFPGYLLAFLDLQIEVATMNGGDGMDIEDDVLCRAGEGLVEASASTGFLAYVANIEFALEGFGNATERLGWGEEHCRQMLKLHASDMEDQLSYRDEYDAFTEFSAWAAVELGCDQDDLVKRAEEYAQARWLTA